MDTAGDNAPLVAWRDRFVRVNGHSLHFVDWGDQSCSPLLLLHGFAMHARVWDTFAAAMAQHWRPIAVDFRGHGDSDWSPDHHYDRLSLASDIAEFISCELTTSPVIVGHSMGGAVALLLATQWWELTQPRALVVIDSSLSLPSKRSEIGRFLEETPLSFDSLDAMVDYASRLSRHRTRKELGESVRKNARRLQDSSWVWKYDPELLAMRRRPNPDAYSMLWRALESVTCPVLYVRASTRSHLHDDQAERMLSVNPLVRLVTVPGTSHSVMRDNPKGFYTAVNRFLDSLCDGDAATK